MRLASRSLLTLSTAAAMNASCTPRLRVALVRHGESMNNVHEAKSWLAYTTNREPDPDLSPRGFEQAQLLGEYLKDTEVGVHNLGDRGHGTWQYDSDVAAGVVSKSLSLRRQTSEKRLSIKWPGDDVSIGDALRGVVGDPEPFVDVMSRALYGDVYGAV